MENKDSKPNTSKSDLIIITPDELLRLGIFKDVQGTVAKKLPSKVGDPTVSLKERIRDRIKQVVKTTDQTDVCDLSKVQKSCDTKTNREENHVNKKPSSELCTPNSINKNATSERGKKLSQKGKSNNTAFENKIKSQTTKMGKFKPSVMGEGDTNTTNIIKNEEMKSKTNLLPVPKKSLKYSEGHQEQNLPKIYKASVEDIVSNTEKKELNIISNTPVHLSNEELKHLVSSAKLPLIDSAKERHTTSENLQSKKVDKARENKMHFVENKKDTETVSKLRISTSKEKCHKEGMQRNVPKKIPKKREQSKIWPDSINTNQTEKKCVIKELSTMKKLIFDVLKEQGEIKKVSDKMSINLPQSSTTFEQAKKNTETEEHDIKSSPKEKISKNLETQEKFDEKLEKSRVVREESNVLDDTVKTEKGEKRDDAKEDCNSVLKQDDSTETSVSKSGDSEYSWNETDNSLSLTISKKLGRKRKLVISDNSPTHEVIVTERNDTEIAETTTQKPEKKRKSSEAPNANNAEDIKLVSSFLNRNESELDRKNSSCRESIEEIIEKIPKKRGRQKKNIMNVDETKQNTEPVKEVTENLDTVKETKAKHAIIDRLKKVEQSEEEPKEELPNLTQENIDSSFTEHATIKEENTEMEMLGSNIEGNCGNVEESDCNKESVTEVELVTSSLAKRSEMPSENREKPQGVKSSNKRGRKKKIADIEETPPKNESMVTPNKAVIHTYNKLEADQSEQVMHEGKLQKIRYEVDIAPNKGFYVRCKNLPTTKSSVPTAPKKRGRKKKADIGTTESKDASILLPNTTAGNTDNKLETGQLQHTMPEKIMHVDNNAPNENGVSSRCKNLPAPEFSVFRAPKKRGRREHVDIESIESNVTTVTSNVIESETDQSEPMHEEIILKDEDGYSMKYSNVSSTESSISIAPKKRGRKKKTANTQETVPKDEPSPVLDIEVEQSEQVIDEEIIQKVDDSKEDIPSLIPISFQENTTAENSKELNESYLIFPTPDTSMEDKHNQTTGKRRGRPKKSALMENKPTELPVPETFTFDESLNGRKRKKINYFEVENVTSTEDDGGRKRRRKAFVSPLKIPRKEKILTESQSSENASDLKSADRDTFPASQSGESSQEEIIEDKNDVAKQEKTKKEQKNQYRKTGETIMMLNNIFTAAFKQKSSQDDAEDDSKGASEELPPPVLIDRRTKLSRIHAIVIDEDNNVMCMECKRKINNDEWTKHNRNIHYNLSWREGEPEVNMSNSELILKLLRPILKEDKYLLCSKCKKQNSSVGGYIAHREICLGIVSSHGQVTCAVCNAVMEKNKWGFHKQKKHNNLAWRVGDRPLNLKDQNLVMTILNALYKARKPLHCDKCGVIKKSVVGFLSHQAQCGTEEEDVKVTCELCNRKMLPVSLQSHMKLSHDTQKQEFLTETSNYFDVSLESLPKREAAKTAMRIIDNINKSKVVQERHKHYIAQVDFEETFIMLLLQKELAQDKLIRCKFKDCEFQTDAVKILMCHMNVCKWKPEQHFICKKCLQICDNEADIKAHIKTTHNIDVIEDDFKADEMEQQVESDENADDIEDDLQPKNVKKKLSNDKKISDLTSRGKPNFLLPLQKRPLYLFCRAFKYTIEFCEANYFIPLLFAELRNKKRDWTLLDEDLTEIYLPETEESCSVAQRRVSGFETVVDREYTFKKFELFESDSEGGIATIFCGGPIYAMAWLPTPYTTSDSKQVLAVAAGRDFDRRYFVSENYTEPCVVQFWDFGVLRNKERMAVPKLMCCLAFDFGPVWHIEWCPSGCYNSNRAEEGGEMQRMGLLAVAGSDSSVYIYSVPFLDEGEMGLIYKTKPVVKLQLSFKDGVGDKRDPYFATKISWSTACGHRYVAVGYSDGMVGLFDLETDSKLLKFKDKDVDVLLPYRRLQAHLHYISALSWVPLGGGNRWLMTASFDRDVFIWDLVNDSKFSSSQKQIITDGQWLSNWLAFITSADESSKNCHAVRMCIQSYRDYLYEHVYLTVSPSTVPSLSTSNWLNSIIQCSAEGETVVNFSNQLLYGLNSEKNLKRLKHYLGYVALVDKQKTPEQRVEEEIMIKEANKKSIQNPFTKHSATTLVFGAKISHYSKYEPKDYKEAADKYGLLFCDMKMKKFSDLQQNVELEELGFSRPNMFSLQKINKIAYNPNRQASLYYATGHEVGFVRVIYLEFLENDPQVV